MHSNEVKYIHARERMCCVQFLLTVSAQSLQSTVAPVLQEVSTTTDERITPNTCSINGGNNSNVISYQSSESENIAHILIQKHKTIYLLKNRLNSGLHHKREQFPF